ncbi:T9SS type A sorting domain-containing protein [Carboxylicivirga sp. M1479]|uniref:T9SS type A sorting domain-containing protein n=1 Tax=Carboxylicivirga sp. M1479 TaxID=2594476 RepID=UPI0011785FF5|nr:T9SS type A sorting domain-containing protein [Carboxylicivirga sp. M1479]TRX71126.1 T9SS type A sorting domain-containing protein [Carboxylicivirga sp. M1479]
MRKHYIYSFLLLSLSVGAFYLWQSTSPTSTYHKDAKTSEYLIQQQINEKVSRRANGYAKQDKPDKYLEYIHLLKTGGDPSSNYSINNALDELKSAKLRRSHLKSAAALDWKERGPGNVGGRTRGLIVDPDDATGNTLFTGPVGGGVWKSADGGNSWACLTLDWPNLSVSSLVMASSNHEVLYAGTGEGFGNLDAIKGNGIFKSTDRGNSWTQLVATIDNDDFKYVNRIAVDYDDEDILVAVTNSGVFKSVDGGVTWTKKYGSSGKVQDLICHPNDYSIQFAAENGIGIIASVDGGETWSKVKEITEGRIELAISKNFPEYVFALTQESNLLLSKDGGDNWISTEPSAKIEFLSGQGWYNNTLVAHPTDKNKLFVGGLNLHEVTLGASSSGTPSSVYDFKNNGADFLAWKSMQGQYQAGAIKVESDNSTLYTDVEISFGTGVSQMAHRFTTTSDLVNPTATLFTYEDYVSVPFKVVDKATGLQMMVSFRDHDNDGKFSLGNETMEQIYVHSAEYVDGAPLTEITVEGGITHNRIVSLYPVLANGYTWDVNNVPASNVFLDNYDLVSTKISSQEISVWWPSSEPNYSHADHHNLHIVENVGDPFRIVNCNDGGVFISDDGGVNWSARISGYVTTQFYGISRHPEKDIYIGGTQDNGTWLSPEDPEKNSVWASALGGDGFETAWCSNDANKIAISLYNNEIKYTHDGGASWNDAQIGDLDDDAPFVTRITNEVSNPNMLLVGGLSGVWRSQDFGRNWVLTNMPAETWNYGSSNPHTAVSPVNSKYVWAGNAISSENTLALSSDGGKSYSAVPKAGGVASFVSDIVAHPKNENGVFVTFAKAAHPKIIYSDDLGQTWTDITSFENDKSTNGFPDVAVYSLIVMPYDTNIIWAGTEIGIFESTDGGQNWHYADNGLPAVCIWDMKIVGQQLIVGTHGLGVWTLDIPQITIDKAPVINRAAKAPVGSYNFEFEFFKAYDKVELFVDESLIETFADVEPGVMSQTLDIDISKAEVSCNLVAYNGAEEQISNYIWMLNPNYKEAVEKYMNPFSNRKYDFKGSGFSISSELFDDWAIHTSHPYSEASDMIYTLDYPIIVTDNREDAIMSYRDIALVEPGEAGTVFGDDEFWDYVIVEATGDGINWVPLLDGYDVNGSSKWSDFADAANAYEDIDKEPNSVSLFEDHTINLHDVFDPGDVILIRFRMYSDANATGWGWVIDDLIIQEKGTSLNLDEKEDFVFELGPNPASEYVNLSINSEDRGSVSVVVYNAAGKPVIVQDYHKGSDQWNTQINLTQQYKGMAIVAVTIDGNVYKKKLIIK